MVDALDSNVEVRWASDRAGVLFLPFHFPPSLGKASAPEHAT